MKLYPLTFTPVLKDYIWGGRNLEKLYHRPLPKQGNIAESWEIAAHGDGTTIVANGRFANMPLTDLYNQLGLDLIGTNAQWAQDRQKFPLLIKLLDANKELSVQVHPDDAYALENEGNELGKSEMWLVLHAEPNAGIILGVTKGTTKEKFKKAITAGNLDIYLHRLPVKNGDVICVPAGTLHAILDGVFIAEIQQNSNTTYRVYDWNRKDAAGNARPLHVEKALDVINFTQVEPKLHSPPLSWHQDGICSYSLCENQYFVTERVEMAPGTSYQGKTDGSTFEIWGTIYGDAIASGGEERVRLPQIRFALMPASLGTFTIQAETETILLRTFLPNPD